MGDVIAAAALQFRRDPRRWPAAIRCGKTGWSRTAARRSHIGAGLVLDQGREALGTTPLDAEPNVILKMPGDTLVPLLSGAGHDRRHRRPGAGELVGGGGRRGAVHGACILAWLWPEAALGETAEPAGGANG